MIRFYRVTHIFKRASFLRRLLLRNKTWMGIYNAGFIVRVQWLMGLMGSDIRISGGVSKQGVLLLFLLAVLVPVFV